MQQSIGEILESARLASGLTLESAAQELRVSAKELDRMERRPWRRPTHELLIRMLTLYGISLLDLPAESFETCRKSLGVYERVRSM